jgi:hypothetical protein
MMERVLAPEASVPVGEAALPPEKTGAVRTRAVNRTATTCDGWSRGKENVLFIKIPLSKVFLSLTPG